MKKLILLMMAAVSLAPAAFAKYETDNEDGGFGIKGGVGLSTIYFKDQDDNFKDLKTKINVAGFLDLSYEIRLHKVFALEPGVVVAVKGAKRELVVPISEDKIKFTTNLQTVDIPLHLKFYIGDHFNIYTGPYVSFITSAFGRYVRRDKDGKKLEDETGVNIMKDKYKDVDGNRPYKRVDAGINLGLEFVTKKGFIVGGRVNQGFIDLTNDDYKGYIGSDAFIFPGDGKWAGNTAFQVYIGGRF